MFSGAMRCRGAAEATVSTPGWTSILGVDQTCVGAARAALLNRMWNPCFPHPSA
jgi:hypothetical protein